MSRDRIEDFGPYRDAVRLFHHVVEDMEMLRNDPRCYRLIGQQVGSSDSICAIQTLRANGAASVAVEPKRDATLDATYPNSIREPHSTYSTPTDQDAVTDDEVIQLLEMFRKQE